MDSVLQQECDRLTRAYVTGQPPRPPGDEIRLSRRDAEDEVARITEEHRDELKARYAGLMSS